MQRAISWLIGCITTETMRDEIATQDTKLKKSVSNMRELQSLTAILPNQANDPELKKSLQKLIDEFRYLALMKNDRKRVLIPCYRDMDPYDLPEELSSLQSQDMRKIGFMQDIIHGVKKVLGSDKQNTPNVTVQAAGPGVASLHKRAVLFLEDKDWDSANEYFDRILDIDPEYAPAYIGKVQVKNQVRREADLARCREPISADPDFQKAVRFADESQKAIYNGYNRAILDRIELERKESAYREALALENRAIGETDFLEAAKKYDIAGNIRDAKNRAVNCRGQASLARTKAEKAAAVYKEKMEREWKERARQEEERRLAEEKRRAEEAERQRKEEELRKEKRKRTLRIFFAVAAAVIIFTGGYFVYDKVIYPKILYQKANSLLAEKDLIVAKNCFLSLGDYSDSLSQIENIDNYIIADSSYENQQYLTAGEQFKALNDFLDAKNRYSEIASILYSNAIQLMKDKKYEEVYNILVFLDDYSDCKELKRGIDSQYELALMHWNNGDKKIAESELQDIAGWPGVNDSLLGLWKDIAKEEQINGNEELARFYYAKIADAEGELSIYSTVEDHTESNISSINIQNFDEKSSLITSETVYSGSHKVGDFLRSTDEQIHMPALGNYSAEENGIFTFRTDAFRQNGAVGKIDSIKGLETIWTTETGSVKGTGQTYNGIGWVGQPVIVKWSNEVREKSNIYESKKTIISLKEVIVGGLDGNIYFIDLEDGTQTRDTIRLGYPMKASPSLHPNGVPFLTVGQYARKMAKGTGMIGLRQYNLYTQKELSLIDGLDAKLNRAFNKIGSFETSALIDPNSDTLVTIGTNGLLYTVKLNSLFDPEKGEYLQNPSQIVLRSKAKNENNSGTAVEASIAMYDKYVFYADMAGILRCVDTDTMKHAWAVELGDAVESTPAIAWHDANNLDLFIATELVNRKTGDAEVLCFNALNGEKRWSTSFGVIKDKKNRTVSGFRASPVIGQNDLSGYVYYTVNNLDDETKKQLGIQDICDAAIISLRAEDGSIVWSHGIKGDTYSSPVAVYKKDGKGAIIQCDGEGNIIMLDGISGTIIDSIKVEGTIEASPAVYNDIMVIATTEENKNYIYGIHIK